MEQPKRVSLNMGASNPQESATFLQRSFFNVAMQFLFVAVQLLVKTTSALQKNECCSATSAVQLTENFTVSGSTPTPWSGPFRDDGLRPWSQSPSEHRKP